MKPGKGKPVQLATDRDEVEQMLLAQKFQRDKIAIEQKHRDAVLALETALEVALAKLEADQALELARLWRKQGRQLGAYHAWLLDREARRRPEMPRDSGERRAR
jgi:hypothetical protein